MQTWIIEPRDPLIVRDGRPFGSTPGERASSLPFPFPSTIAGGVRTRAGLKDDGTFDAGMIPEVLKIEIRGPVLVELSSNSGIEGWFFPAPADALLLDGGRPDVAVLRRLVPLQAPSGAVTNLSPDLALVGSASRVLGKPDGRAPRFWYWPRLKEWLQKPDAGLSDFEVTLSGLGHNGPVRETRTHVSIQPDTQAAREGFLFQTRGLEFTKEGGRKRLALAVIVEGDAASKIAPGIAPLAGERRLVLWRQSQKSLPPCLDELRAAIIRDRHCRVVLLTPAFFQNGSRPQWLLNPQSGCKGILKALAIGRPQVVSGWDFEHARPKGTRRLASAGTVLFLRLEGTDQAVSDWIDAVWMRSISDTEQDRLDGFGLAALGVWDGTLRQME